MCGAFDMDSKPPTNTQSVSPNAIDWAPNAIDFKPDEQSLFMLVHGVVMGRPLSREAWRVGPWPRPAERTFPMMT
jgi:hypothetical protein